jgi:hypothetical protein
LPAAAMTAPATVRVSAAALPAAVRKPYRTAAKRSRHIWARAAFAWAMICRLVRSRCSDDKLLKSKALSLPAHIVISFNSDIWKQLYAGRIIT